VRVYPLTPDAPVCKKCRQKNRYIEVWKTNKEHHQIIHNGRSACTTHSSEAQLLQRMRINLSIRVLVLKAPRSTVFDTAWRWGYVERAWGVGAGAPLGACGAQFGAHGGA